MPSAMPPAKANPDAALEPYRRKRDFTRTPEPKAVAAKPARAGSFVIQKHAATRLHYDFRLELDGVLLSWAVPKGPSFDPAEKRMAVHVEDHPVSYGGFEGTIPPKQYGAGSVIVWDRGTWEPVGDARAGMADGKLVFRLHGEKLAGLWELVRIRKPGDRQDPWLLFKKKDEWARPLADYDVVSALPDSVIAKPLGPAEARSPAPGASPAAAQAAAAAPIRHDRLHGAVPAALPAKLSPQLATLAKSPPETGDWLYEIKFDGYRVMARIEGGKARLITRGGHDWTAKMASLGAAVEQLGVDSGWLDGEIVVLGADGTPDFNALQNAFDAARTEQIRYFLFDVPYFEGHDLRKVPLQSRRTLLRQLLDARGGERVRFSDDFPGDGAGVLANVCRLGLEGVIAKRREAPYVSQRSETWLKLKCGMRQEFVIGGYTERSSGGPEVGSLLLGVHDDEGRLVYAGNVGTGWDAETAVALRRKLQKLEVPAKPFDLGNPTGRGRWSRRTGVEEHWVQPKLVVEVSFTEWTPDGHVRHASFQGLRTDKPPKEIRRETAGAPPDSVAINGGRANGSSANGGSGNDGTTNGGNAKRGRANGDGADAPASASATPPSRRGAPRAGAGTKVSNPERVIDASTGLKKLDLVRYYESVADWILPHLRARPVSLVRGPAGVGGELFFQKHGDKIGIPGIRELDPKLWPGHQALLEIDNVEALVGAAQLNVIELHTWNSTTRQIDKPDRVIFDLDPGEGVTWPHLQEAALLTRTMLTELGLRSWLKTSGGKGLHVVVPLAPRFGYDDVKGFSKAVVEHLAKTIPSRFVAKSGGANRIGRIFVDYLRNGHGATTVAAYSARARPGLGVSMPVTWEQLPALKGGAQWTIATAREHLSFQSVDPWADCAATKQPLAAAMKRIGYVPVKA
jgi:bifunctional non-homologous end joining protein LigD